MSVSQCVSLCPCVSICQCVSSFHHCVSWSIVSVCVSESVSVYAIVSVCVSESVCAIVSVSVVSVSQCQYL